jgi:phosphatidylglycerophosphate synthase
MTNDAVEGTGADSLWNIPNILTMARLVAIPMLIVVFYSNYVSDKWVGLTEESLSDNIF